MSCMAREDCWFWYGLMAFSHICTHIYGLGALLDSIQVSFSISTLNIPSDTIKYGEAASGLVSKTPNRSRWSSCEYNNNGDEHISLARLQNWQKQPQSEHNHFEEDDSRSFSNGSDEGLEENDDSSSSDSCDKESLSTRLERLRSGCNEYEEQILSGMVNTGKKR